jgi:hypothetical protein
VAVGTAVGVGLAWGATGTWQAVVKARKRIRTLESGGINDVTAEGVIVFNGVDGESLNAKVAKVAENAKKGGRRGVCTLRG